MNGKIYKDDDADLLLLSGKRVAILGYGAQGHAHAQNLRDSGIDVVVGQRPGPGFDLACKHGFQPVAIDQAVAQCDLINVLLPDEVHGEAFAKWILPNLSPGNILMACHGFSYTYQQMIPPAGIDYLLVAPKGAGHQVRGQFESGGGVPCLIATSPGSRRTTFDLGLAYAKALGGTRAGVLPIEIDAETETDLFGEQVVLCGGVSELIKAAFETLVQAGYQPELAYFECLHELMLTVDLIHRGGLRFMRDMISNTAEYGDYSVGRRIITDQTRQEMKKILAEIQDGTFAKAWLAEHKDGQPTMSRHRRENAQHPIENVGNDLRKLMPWLNG